jgi:MscS family membrane protein
MQVVLSYVAFNELDGFLSNFVFRHWPGKAGKVRVSLADMLDHIFLLLFIVFLSLLISRIIDFIYYYRMQRATNEKNNSRLQLLPLIKEMSKLILWIISCFWILGWVFHVNIPALITGLGIGGVAIALAGKETVENFFAAFTILSDRPFQTGDLIKIGDTEAVVERIGFRSTRLRNTDGSAFIIPNQSLVSQNLTNLSARDRRGIKVVSHIKHGLSYDQLQQLAAELRAAVLAIPGVKEPVIVGIDAYEKETFQLSVNYDLPHPLPDGMELVDIKRQVSMKIYEVITARATLGTPIGTS